MQFGTARNPASRNLLSPQPSNLEGTLSHQLVSRPGPPPIGCMSFSRKDSRTAFLAHWLTVQAPSAPFTATRSRPSSRAARAASTASRTAPVVAAPTVSRFSHAASIVAARSARVMELSGSRGELPAESSGASETVNAARKPYLRYRRSGARVRPRRCPGQSNGLRRLARHRIDQQGVECVPVRRTAELFAHRPVAQKAGYPGKRLEMIGAGVFRRQQQEQQIDRLVVHRIEIDRLLKPREDALDPVNSLNLP